jgi:maleylacetate reductase
MMSVQHPFTFAGISTRVIFGSGTIARAGAEIERLGRKGALVLSTPHQADEAAALAARLGPLAKGIFTEAAMHTPVEVTARAVAAFWAMGADCVVSLGGGSTTGLGKAIATRTGVDQIVIPTTYAGSEMTDILGETNQGRKTTRRDPSIRPETVIYDVDLTLSLPPTLTVTSALNAIAHGVEALYAPDANPILSLMSVEAMRAFKGGLPRVMADPTDKAARADVLYGAWLCSTALAYITMALHHKLAHVLGGSFGTPHAETHAILIPHTAGFNAVAVPDALAPVAAIFGGSVGGGLWDFAKSCGAPLRLADLGLTEADLDRAAAIAVENPYANPRPFGQADIRALLQAAYEGARPTT